MATGLNYLFLMQNQWKSNFGTGLTAIVHSKTVTQTHITGRDYLSQLWTHADFGSPRCPTADSAASGVRLYLSHSADKIKSASVCPLSLPSVHKNTAANRRGMMSEVVQGQWPFPLLQSHPKERLSIFRLPRPVTPSVEVSAHASCCTTSIFAHTHP